MRVEHRFRLRQAGFAICFFVTILYIFLIVSPSIYCLTHGCRGPGEGDAFMPAFFLSPWGAIATAFSLGHAIHNVRKGQRTWIFWPLAVIFAIVLLATIAFFGMLIYELSTHRK
jgi:hypothetical protein